MIELPVFKIIYDPIIRRVPHFGFVEISEQLIGIRGNKYKLAQHRLLLLLLFYYYYYYYYYYDDDEDDNVRNDYESEMKVFARHTAL